VESKNYTYLNFRFFSTVKFPCSYILTNLSKFLTFLDVVRGTVLVVVTCRCHKVYLLFVTCRCLNVICA